MKAKWFWVSFAFVAALNAVFSMAYALGLDPSVPIDDQGALNLGAVIWDAIVNKHYALALGPAVALVVFGLRKYDKNIPKYGAQIDAFLNKPFVAFLLPTLVAAVGGLGTAIAAGKPPLDAVKSVFEAAMSAVFVYVGVKKAAEKQAAGEAAVAVVDAGGKQAAIDELKKP